MAQHFLGAVVVLVINCLLLRKDNLCKITQEDSVYEKLRVEVKFRKTCV